MKGCLVLVSRRLVVSPMVNIKVIAIRKANNPLPLHDHNRAFGKVIDASLISSAK